MESDGCCDFHLKTYKALFIQQILGNRFIFVSNYGFKIYALNEKNEYSIVLLKVFHEGIRDIYELDKDNFIFLSEIECGDSIGWPAHNILILDKVEIKEISQNDDDYYDYDIYDNDNNDYDNSKMTEEDKKIIKNFLTIVNMVNFIILEVMFY